MNRCSREGMSIMPKCPICCQEVDYPRMIGKSGTYHFDCFLKSEETVGSAYLSPPSQESATAVVTEEKKARRRARGKRRG